MKCSCGSKFLVLLSELSEDVGMIAQPCEPPTAWCPGCTAIWQHDGKAWARKISQSTLAGLRMLSNTKD